MLYKVYLYTSNTGIISVYTYLCIFIHYLCINIHTIFIPYP
nr:MAG TPA: hypothetical protein [Caudoviricetes sp.]